jgi:GTP-binding protein Era
VTGLPEGGGRSGFVALLGWTNVGKSTLLNRFVGEKLAAVADVSQTTRNRISGVRTIPGRGQVVFVDTPGFHHPRYRMNRSMVEAARQSLGSVDLALFLIDAAKGTGPGDEEAAMLLQRSGVARLGVLNKIDRVHDKTRLLPMMQTMQRWGFAESFPVSALTGEGCDCLLERVVASLPESPPLFPDDELTDQPERALAAEWIREKILHHTRQELPHATAVLVERWQEREDGLLAIDATVLVERESQKGIVIGKGGSLLKRIGTESREEIERFLDAQVFLRLWVKVRPDWRNDPAILRRLGIG